MKRPAPSWFALKAAVRLLLCCLGLSPLLEISAAAVTTNDARALFDSYTNAFYSSHGASGYFKATQTGGVADFWKQAEEIESIIDACEWTSNTNYRVLIASLLAGFEKNHGANWASNPYNDDSFWACIAFARGFQTCGNPRFRDIAQTNFDLVFARAWDTNLGGGLYWTTTNRSKNACVNGPGGIAACLLFQICGDPGYLAKASNIFQWERSVLFNPRTGAVADAIDLRGRVHSWASTYNQGTFIGLANFLGHTDDAILAANYTRDHLANAGLLPQYGIAGNNSGFNAIFIRWLVRFIRDRGLQAEYQPWLQANAAAAWKIRRATDGLSWCQWQQPTPAGTNLHSWDCIASLEVIHALLPPAAEPPDPKH